MQASDDLAQQRAGDAAQPHGAGQLSLLIADEAVRGLRYAARRSGCRLAEMLLAVFGLALDRLGMHGESSIAILWPDSAPGGELHRGSAGGAAQAHDAAAMPLDMRRAIAGAGGLDPEPALARGGVAFRYTRHWLGEAAIARLLESDTAGDRRHDGEFDLLLAASEFDDELLLECIFRTAVTPYPSAVQLLHAYASDLSDIAGSLPEPSDALRV